MPSAPDNCPVCDEPYANRVSLDRRTTNRIDISDYSELHQHREQRSSGPVAGHKSTRADSESYTYIGYFHE